MEATLQEVLRIGNIGKTMKWLSTHLHKTSKYFALINIVLHFLLNIILFIASSSVPHTATENVQIAGQLIPKDAIVMAVLPSSHLDASNFSQPYQFRPERFIDDTTGKVCRDDHLIPFSMGKSLV